MTPDWYELLGVERDADTATIRAAWKSAIADLDPTDRTFKLYSQAGAVLLDEERRAAYDAQLTAEEQEADQETPDEDDPAPGDAEPDDPATEVEPEDHPAKPAATTSTAPAAKPAQKATRPRVRTLAASTGLLGVLGALTVVVLAAAATFQVTAPCDPGPGEVLGNLAFWDDDGEAGSEPRGSEGAVEAAEAAVVPLLGYDHTRLEEGFEEAERHLAPSFREEYEQFSALLAEQARANEVVVKVAPPKASAVGRTGCGFVDVIVFVDRQITNKGRSTPVPYEDQTTLRMEKVDGEWLVANLTWTPPAS